MNARLRSQFASWTVAALLVLATSVVACVDEKIVFRDAPRFQNPPAAAGNYLGYTDTTAKITACGSCHVEVQAQWRGTAHATAFGVLPATAQPFCQACHAVGHLGNADTTTNAGWNGSRDRRYVDVQCENCHGPGLTHASTPNSTNRPIPSLNVDTTAAARRGTCGECHAGTHHPYLTEWRASGHGAMPNWNSPKTRPECQACHTGQGALASMGVDATSNYREKNYAGGDTLRITCGVCHDPHANTNGPGQLRLPVNTADPERNLCMKCHNRRAIPEISSQTRGPHSAEGPLVIGTAGWEPPGIDVPSVPSTHGNQSANPRLCATCHVARFTVNDSVGNFSYQVTGHRFDAAPCVGANGRPTGSTNCAWTTTARAVASCASSTCHGNSSADAVNAVRSDSLLVASLAATVRRKLNAVPAGQIAQNSVYTVAEGARFNWLLAVDSLTGGPVGGQVKVGALVHNRRRVSALLAASALALDAAYPGLPAATAAEQAALTKALAESQVRISNATMAAQQVTTPPGDAAVRSPGSNTISMNLKR